MDPTLSMGSSTTSSSNPEDYRVPYFMKLSDDIATVEWSYAQVQPSSGEVLTVDRIETHKTGYTDVIWAVSRRILADFSDMTDSDTMYLYRIHTDTKTGSSFTRDGQLSQIVAIKMKLIESSKTYVSNLYFDPILDVLGITYYSRNSTNNDFRITRIEGLESKMSFDSAGSI